MKKKKTQYLNTFSKYFSRRSFSLFINHRQLRTEKRSLGVKSLQIKYLFERIKGCSLLSSCIYLSTNGFAALNVAILWFNLGPFYLCPPTHERLHPRKGRAIFSRHPLGVSHSCLFRAISIRPRVQRREKTSGKSGENVETWNEEKGKRKQNISCS